VEGPQLVAGSEGFIGLFRGFLRSLNIERNDRIQVGIEAF